MIFTAFIWQLSLSPSLSLPCSEGTTGTQYAVQLVAASLSIADLPTWGAGTAPATIDIYSVQAIASH